MLQIIISELNYLRRRLGWTSLACFWPAFMVFMNSLIDRGEFTDVSFDEAASAMFLAFFFAILSGMTVMMDAPEKPGMRVRMLLMTPLSGRRVWLGLMLSRLVMVLPGVAGIWILPFLLPAKLSNITIPFAVSYTAILLIVIWLVHLNRKLKEANTTGVRWVIITWNALLVVLLVQQLMASNTNPYTIVYTDSLSEADLLAATRMVNLLLQWGAMVVTFALTYLTFAVRRDHTLR